jgi:xanthine dehydrogenase accessory factor
MGELKLPRVLIAGGGELGSAVAHSLARSGIEVGVVDIAEPRCIRRKVCFATAIRAGSSEIEGIVARRVSSAGEMADVASSGRVAVMAGDFLQVAGAFKPDVLVDARMLKRDSAISLGIAPLTVGLGPGFTAGVNADVVIETNRGHDLGRAIYRGSAAPHTGVPGAIMGFTSERVVRAPASGGFNSRVDLGTVVDRGAVLGMIDDAAAVTAPIGGLVRGLIADGTDVERGQKIGDIDPRGAVIDPCTISDKGRTVAGAVLEAIMYWWTRVAHD